LISALLGHQKAALSIRKIEDKFELESYYEFVGNVGCSKEMKETLTCELIKII